MENQKGIMVGTTCKPMMECHYRVGDQCKYMEFITSMELPACRVEHIANMEECKDNISKPEHDPIKRVWYDALTLIDLIDDELGREHTSFNSPYDKKDLERIKDTLKEMAQNG